MPTEPLISCPEGQSIVGIKNGAINCGYPNSQPHTIYAIAFGVTTAFVWLAVLCVFAKLADRQGYRFRGSGSTAAGGSGIFSLITAVTLLIMFGIYRLLNYALGLDF